MSSPSQDSGTAIQLKVSPTEADALITERIKLGRRISDLAIAYRDDLTSAARDEMYTWDEYNRTLLPTLFDGPILDEYGGYISFSVPSTAAARWEEFQAEIRELLRQLSSIRSRIQLWGESKVPKYFHVRLTERGQRKDEVKVDMNQETLESQFLTPYREGNPITINGRSIPAQDIERLRISASDVPSADIIARLKAEDAMSTVAVIGGPSYAWRAAAQAEDATDQYITGPPGTKPIDNPPVAIAATGGGAAMAGPGDRKSVFIVTGRDSTATSSVTAVLRALGLRIVEWEHAVAKTGLPNPYIGDVGPTCPALRR